MRRKNPWAFGSCRQDLSKQCNRHVQRRTSADRHDLEKTKAGRAFIAAAVENALDMDGVPYTVTFNIRDKGKDQYQYFIDFKEDKTPGLSNTAAKSLLRADQASYSKSIPQKSDLSTGNQKNSEKADLDERDTEYLSAVERGDMETAQRMVDEAAKADMIYPVKLKARSTHMWKK